MDRDQLLLGLSVSGVDNFAHLGGLLGGAAAGALVEGVGPVQSRRAVTVGGLIGIWRSPS